MEQKTIFMRIYKQLFDNGIEVYSPAQKPGECMEPYVVVKNTGTMIVPGFSTTRTLYDVMCYVPKDRYTELESYVDRIKDIMKGLYPMLVPTYFETPSFYDDTVHAHMSSIQYRNLKKI